MLPSEFWRNITLMGQRKNHSRLWTRPCTMTGENTRTMRSFVNRRRSRIYLCTYRVQWARGRNWMGELCQLPIPSNYCRCEPSAKVHTATYEALWWHDWSRWTWHHVQVKWRWSLSQWPTMRPICVRALTLLCAYFPWNGSLVKGDVRSRPS